VISLLSSIWSWCCWLKDVILNYSVGKGFRWSSGSFVCSIAVSFYTFLAWLVSSLFTAISDLITQVPLLAGEVSSAMSASKSSMTAGGGGSSGGIGLGGDFLSMANYILPIDFLASCLCIYFSVWLTCWVVGIMFKFFDFLSDVNPIG
jgi:hypothetical protein